MIATAEVAKALTGALKLAQLDRGGLAYFDATPSGFWKSFAAAFLVLPGHALVYHLSRADIAAPLWREAAIGTIAYVIGWVAFPLAMAGICDLIDRRGRYIRFIVAANWGSVLQVAVLVPVSLLRMADGGASLLIYTIALVAVLAYGWFIARTALEVDGITAAGLVLFSLLLDMFVTGTGDALLVAGQPSPA